MLSPTSSIGGDSHVVGAIVAPLPSRVDTKIGWTDWNGIIRKTDKLAVGNVLFANPVPFYSLTTAPDGDHYFTGYTVDFIATTAAITLYIDIHAGT